MAIDDLTIVRRSLLGRPFSSGLTVASVAVAVALMLTLLSLRDSGRRAFERGTGNAHMLVSAEPSALNAVLNTVYYANAPSNALPMSLVEELAARHPLEWVVPTQLGDSWRGSPVMATTGEFFTRFEPALGEPWAFADGRAFAAPFELVAGSDVARVFGVRVGDRLHLTHGSSARDGSARGGHVHDEFTFSVVGVLAPTHTAHDRALFTSLESSWVLHAHDRRLAELGPDAPLTTTADITDGDRMVTGVYARVLTRPGRQASAQVQPVFNALRADPRVTVAQPADQVRRLLEIVSSVDVIFLGMAAAVLASSGVSILLVLWLSMDLRRRQIAVLRVLGASAGRVFGMVVTEAAIIGMAGAVSGIALAVLGGRIVSGILADWLGVVVEPSLGWRTLAVVGAATIALAAAAGLAPAVSAYRTSVVRNLKPLA